MSMRIRDWAALAALGITLGLLLAGWPIYPL
jgi:hypothetical protein